MTGFFVFLTIFVILLILIGIGALIAYIFQGKCILCALKRQGQADYGYRKRA